MCCRGDLQVFAVAIDDDRGLSPDLDALSGKESLACWTACFETLSIRPSFPSDRLDQPHLYRSSQSAKTAPMRR